MIHPMTSPALSAKAPIIRNREDFKALIENIVQLQHERAELEAVLIREMGALREKYRAPMAEVERLLTLEMSWAEAWARSNPGLESGQSLDCSHARVGFQVAPFTVERASRKWTWSAIVLKLSEVAWGRRYLRPPSPEVDKEALLADRARLSEAELRLAGLKIVQRARFMVTPHGRAKTGSIAETEWEAAA